MRFIGIIAVYSRTTGREVRVDSKVGGLLSFTGRDELIFGEAILG